MGPLKTRLILAAASLAMLDPALVAGGALLAQDTGVRGALGFSDVTTPALRALEGARRPENWGQVRIEERVIIRISPSSPEVRQRLQELTPRRSNSFREVSHDGCVRVGNIVAVQPTNDNRLLLFMQNRNVLVASLERGCDARAFYSSVYLERNEDGRLCVDRDRVQSRAGASCMLDTMRRIVPLDDDE